MAIGVFGLQVAYKLKRIELMSSNQTHGWFGGGGLNPGTVSTVDRIDFSNDTGTTNIRGSLSLARFYLAATGNSNYGWFGGGTGVPLVSTVDRIDFSNDAATASARGPLSAARAYMAATGNSNYGWFGGGGNPAGVSKVERIDFSNDSSTASPRGPLSVTRRSPAATGNSNYGWFGGGWNPSFPTNLFYSTVDRIDFSNDAATASVRGSLSSARYHMGATGNSNYGWFGGGNTPGPTVSTVERIDFSNDSSTASIRGPLSAAKGYIAATGNSNYGWFGGGGLGGILSTTVDRIDFSNDSVSASPRGLLSLAKYRFAATAGQAKGPAIKLQKAGNYGWFGGGFDPSPFASVATVNRIDFSNDSGTASPRGPLSAARYQLAATSNSNYGWFNGGNIFPPGSPTAPTIVDRIDFSNDSVSASVRGPLNAPAGKSSHAATGNSNYGWFGGGFDAAIAATVNRINFSNDSVSASPRGPLSLARYSLAATGNSNYGWFGGGRTPAAIIATVDRIDFSNDAATASPRNPLSSSRYKLAATGNSNYGWFGGGGNPSLSPAFSTVDRINFSNDLSAISVRGPLNAPAGRNNSAATGNSNYGWFGGGNVPTPATVATVDRIDFSNDSVSASPRGSLFTARYSLAATSNTTR